jgi:uncharacterized membrane protein YqjE
MNAPTGADRSEEVPEAPGLQAAAGAFTSSLVRFLQALTGLFGLELRETGAQALVLGLLGVAIIVAAVFAYLFLLLGTTMLLVGWLGGGWLTALFGLCVFHLLLAAVLALILRSRATKPLFPGTREALRREAQRLS